MSTTISKPNFDRMQSLYELREKKLLDSISVLRGELDTLLEKLAEQQQLIKTLRDDLEELHSMRSNQNIDDMSVQSFRVESERREWLIYDLEKEEFYLPGFETDVAEGRKKLAVARGKWVRMRERSKALQKNMEEQRRHERNKQVRLDEAVQDERQVIGSNQHG